MQVIIKVSISNDVTSGLKNDESLHISSNSAHEISKPESDNVSKNVNDAKYANLTAEEKSKLSHWNDFEQKHWGKHRLPYIPDMRNKLANSEMLAIAHSNVEICSRVPQACRKNAVFLINAKNTKDLDDGKSDLNGTFRKSIESKWNAAETEIGEYLKVIAIASNRNILDKNQIDMKINRSENSHELIRNIVYFKDKVDKDSSKIVLQYYIDRRTCGDKEEVEYIASSHGNRKNQKLSDTMKKVFFQILKTSCYIKEKRN